MSFSERKEFIREFLLDHIENLRPIISREFNIKNLKLLRSMPGRRTHIYASLTNIDNYNFTLVIYYTYLKNKKNMCNETYFSKVDLIKTLCHELAHVMFMEHCTNHTALEALLLLTASIKLKEDGYISEEDELARFKFLRI